MALSDHKTKLTGLILTIVSTIQANTDVLQSVLSPKAFAWLTAAIGAVVTAIGFVNSSHQDNSPSAKGASK